GGFDDIEVKQEAPDGTWNLVGQPDEIDPSAGDAKLSSFFADSTGAPVVAFRQFNVSGTVQFYVTRWNGTNWVILGGAPIATGDAGAQTFYLAAIPAAGGKIFAAYSDAPGTLFGVKEWTGSAWADVSDDVKGGDGGPFLHV